MASKQDWINGYASRLTTIAGNPQQLETFLKNPLSVLGGYGITQGDLDAAVKQAAAQGSAQDTSGGNKSEWKWWGVELKLDSATVTLIASGEGVCPGWPRSSRASVRRSLSSAQ